MADVQHICMSGNLGCSGINPCDPCLGIIISAVLVPSMKVAGIDGRNDPRVMQFLQTYTMRQRSLVGELMSRQPPVDAPFPMAPEPPVVAPLTEAELEGMAKPMHVHATRAEDLTGTAPENGTDIPPAMPVHVGGMPVQETLAPEPSPPAGLMSDEEFKRTFPNVVAENVMVMPEPKPAPTVVYQDSDSIVTAETAETLPPPEAEKDAEVARAPTEPPLSTSQAKAAPRVLIRTPLKRKPPAETTDTDTEPASDSVEASTQPVKQEASNHG